MIEQSKNILTSTDYHWYSNFDSLPHGKDSFRQSAILLVGASGSGKSTISTALSKIEPRCHILRNYTTRRQRPTDQPEHFTYLSEETFLKEYAEGQFFLARLNKYPEYGYKTNDLIDVLSKKMYPILMFRHAGIRYLFNLVAGTPTIFLEGEPANTVVHSKNVIAPLAEEGVRNLIIANRYFQKQMSEQHLPFLTIYNQYHGMDEINTIAQYIKCFLHKTRNISTTV